MNLGTLIAAATAASLGAFTALAQPATQPPMPKPAAGALPNPNPNAVQRSFRAQTPQEQQQGAYSAARDASGRVAAQTASNPPTPKPAAGALSNPNPNAVQKSFRPQTPQEQQDGAYSAARDVSGRMAAQTATNPPTPKPAAGAVPNVNPNAVQRSFRAQTPQEQQSSTAAQPHDVGQSGRTRTAN